MESKYPKQKVIAVDVDDTLIINREPNLDLIEWLRVKKAEGYYLMLWSMRGRENAISAATTTNTHGLFHVVMSKPGYIVDDDGWGWTQHTEVISPDMKVIKRKRKPVLNSGAAMRRNRDRKRSKL